MAVDKRDLLEETTKHHPNSAYRHARGRPPAWSQSVILRGDNPPIHHRPVDQPPPHPLDPLVEAHRTREYVR